MKPIIQQAWRKDKIGRELLKNFDEIMGYKDYGERRLHIALIIPNATERNKLIKLAYKCGQKQEITKYCLSQTLSLFFGLSARQVINILK